MRTVIVEEGKRFDEALLQRSGAIDPEVLTSAAQIIGEVRKRGDEALIEFTEKFDHVVVKHLRVSEEEIDAAFDQVSDEVFESLVYAANRIGDFHQRNAQESMFVTDEAGVLLGTKITPLDVVGIYVPGGRAQYPSTVLMNAVPARVAGVRKVIMCTPPAADGSVDATTLVAARLAGVDEVYKVGGAHAIAAMAYGTQTIPKVDKVTGPGNAYVAAAKRCVSGDVGIDMIAGPSEVCVLADGFCEPRFVAIDLMAQAEHDPAASCYLVVTDEELATEVQNCIAEMLPQSPRQQITQASLDDHGLVVICPDLATAIDAVNIIAPEHLEMHVDSPMELLGTIRHAGAIFLGEFTPESCGDYVAGPNHTLPTGGTARFSSPLSAETFTKKSNVIQYTYRALLRDSNAIQTIADKEGLWSHARAVSLREEVIETAYQELMAEDEEGEEDDCGCGHDHHHHHE